MLKYHQGPVFKDAHENGGWCLARTDQKADDVSFVSGGMDGTIRGWKVAENKIESLFGTEAHSLGIVSLASSKSGNLVASSSLDGFLKLWSRTGETLSELAKVETNVAEAWGLSISPDERFVASGSHSFRVNIWSCEDELTRETTLKSEKNCMVTTVTYSSDGKIIAAGSTDGSIQLFDIERGSVSTKLPGHAQPVRSAKFSPVDPDLLFTCGDDQQINIYDTRNSQLVANLAGHEGFVFAVDPNEDNARIASAGADNTVRVRSNMYMP